MPHKAMENDILRITKYRFHLDASASAAFELAWLCDWQSFQIHWKVQIKQALYVK